MGSLPNLHAIGSERPAASRLQPWDDCMLELSGCPSPRACRLHRASLSSSGASSVRRLIASVRSAPPALGPGYPRRRLLRNHAALCLGQVSWSGGPAPLLALSAWWPGAAPGRAPLLAAALFAAAALSCVAAPPLVRRLGAARLLLAGHALAACFLAAHLLPVPAALVPAYLLQGAALGPVNLARVAQLWALSTRLPGCDVTAIGAGGGFGDAGLTLGSALAAALLAWAASTVSPMPGAVCGASACPPASDADADAAAAAGDVSEMPAPASSGAEELGCRAGPLLAAVLLGLAVAGAALSAACLDRLPAPPPPPSRPRPPPAPAPAAPAAGDGRLPARVARAFAAPPLALFVGLGQAFMMADFSRWYVACVLSLPSVSLCFVALGALRCVASLTLNLVLPHICRLLAVGVGAAFHSCLLLVLVLWQPSSDDSALFFVIAAAWGVCDSIWETLALTSGLTSQGDAWPEWLARWDMFRCLGLALAFVLHPLLCVQVKLYILAATLVLGVPPYAWLEIQHDAKMTGL
ncbi:UNC93-like protein [Schistocerca serialis cubense]|uniref:UNC93-like protein n=1 Tax=Schistocerca serialis cubense TaxID=2023355 RepID=UPI00214F3AD7|nr:UNC93-like protein [Schistocerca serialis cubense]